MATQMTLNLIDRIRLAWRIVTAKPEDINSLKHAQRELPATHPDEEGDSMQRMMNRNLMEIILVFATQGHSGFSASYAVACLEKLLRFEPLGPLTGEDSEWNEIGEGRYQNNRYGSVFKDKDRFDGQAYDSEAVIFRESDGCCFMSRDSAQPVTFPYTPKHEYRDVPANGGEGEAA
jgi:hypothetical protein